MHVMFPVQQASLAWNMEKQIEILYYIDLVRKKRWSEHCCVSCGFTLLWHYIPLISMCYIIVIKKKIDKSNSFLQTYVIW